MNSAGDAQIQGMPDLSAAISKIMEHPELISMAAAVLGNTSAEAESSEDSSEGHDSGSTSVSSEPAASASPPSELISTLAPMLSKLSALGSNGATDKKSFRHEALLCALRPYLSQSRVEAIDYIIKISKMSALIQGLK